MGLRHQVPPAPTRFKASFLMKLEVNHVSRSEVVDVLIMNMLGAANASSDGLVWDADPVHCLRRPELELQAATPRA